MSVFEAHCSAYSTEHCTVPVRVAGKLCAVAPDYLSWNRPKWFQYSCLKINKLSLKNWVFEGKRKPPSMVVKQVVGHMCTVHIHSTDGCALHCAAL